MVRFSSVLRFFSVLWTGPANTTRDQLVWIWGPHPLSHWGLFHKNNCWVCHGLLLFEGPVCALTTLTPQNFWLLVALQPHCKTFQQHVMSLSCCFHFHHCSHHCFHGLDSVTVVEYCSILLLFCILILFLWCCFRDFHSMVALLEIRQPDHPTIYMATTIWTDCEAVCIKGRWLPRVVSTFAIIHRMWDVQ